jgi:hypothetical protein
MQRNTVLFKKRVISMGISLYNKAPDWIKSRDQGEGFPSTQHYLSSSYYLFLSRYMFLSYDHLQVEIYTVEINLTYNGSVVF